MSDLRDRYVEALARASERRGVPLDNEAAWIADAVMDVRDEEVEWLRLHREMLHNDKTRLLTWKQEERETREAAERRIADLEAERDGQADQRVELTARLAAAERREEMAARVIRAAERKLAAVRELVPATPGGPGYRTCHDLAADIRRALDTDHAEGD